jgi:hypothetical protein
MEMTIPNWVLAIGAVAAFAVAAGWLLLAFNVAASAPDENHTAPPGLIEQNEAARIASLHKLADRQRLQKQREASARTSRGGCEMAVMSAEARKDDKEQDSLLNPVHRVYFRAGLLACREYMARFVEAQDPTIAQSIRANWWPSLGVDPGPPRKMEWGELTEGEFGTPSFRCKTAEEVSPSIEALPVALGFLELPPTPPASSREGAP